MNKIAKDHVIYAMSSENKPVLNVHSGDRITFETMDCYSDEVTPDEPDRRCHRINPANGPAAVEEAMPGDTLKVTIEKISLGSRALVGSYPNSGTMKELVNDSLFAGTGAPAGISQRSDRQGGSDDRRDRRSPAGKRSWLRNSG